MLPFVSVMGHTVPVYGALGILGFLLGMLFILLAAPRFGLKRDDAAYIYVFAALGGLAGAKLLYILTVLPELAELIRAGAGAHELMGYVSGGLVFFGGVFGALPAAYLSARAYRVKLADFLPVLVPCIAVIGCLGRVGCFCAGCCYGDRSRSGHIPVGFTTFCSGGDPTGRGTASTRNRPCHDRQRQVSVCIALRDRKRAARGLYDRSDSDRTPSQINAHHANSLLLHIAGWKQLTSGKRITPAT